MSGDWITSTIDDLCGVEFGTRVVRRLDGGSAFPVYGGGGATFSMDTFNRESRVVIARFGMSKECTRFVPEKFFLNDSGLTLSTTNPSRLLQDYLDWYTLSLNDYIFNLGRGTAQKNLDVTAFRALPVVYPRSLGEQERIVASLDEAFEGIGKAVANAERNLASARELFESYLNSVFIKRVESWSKKSLEEIGRLQTGTTPKTSEKDNLGTYIPFIKPGDFREDGSLDYENEGLSKLGLTQSRLIRGGSAVMVCIGATIGKAGFAERDISANQQINAVTPGEGIAGKFLYYQMISDGFQKQVMANSAQATLPIINKTKWGGLVLLLPPTRREQEQLVSRLDQLSSEVQRLEETYRQKLARLAELKEAILQKAFAGELTAQPDKALPQAAE